MIFQLTLNKYKTFIQLRKINKSLLVIQNLIQEFLNKSDDEIKNIFFETKNKIKNYIDKNNNSYDISSDFFIYSMEIITALVCVASDRVRNEKPFKTQIQGALALNFLNVIELATGQGKTLTATLSAIFRSNWTHKVHIITANDYLAQRDEEDMRELYNFFDIKTGYVTRNIDYIDKIHQYKQHVVYISNQEISFDYLKSNMQYNKNNVAINSDDFQHVIIDEIDLVAIDNARIPTIISTTSNQNDNFFYKIAYKIVNQFTELEVDIDYKDKNVFVKMQYIDKLEVLICQSFAIDITELYNPENIDIFFYIDRCLRAKFIFNKNNEYIVANDSIGVVDEYTGRVPGDRKFSMGIHQALEAKENLKISSEGISTNYITTQNIYRKYLYKSGLTGTILVDREEIEVIYNVQVIKIPCFNANMKFNKDIFFTTKELKYEAIASKVQQLQFSKRPVLIGTSNIQESEEIAFYLKKYNIKFNLLNAKCLDIEAKIISNAGKPGRVTIATNLAGRGTDIKLGGNVNQQIKFAIDQYISKNSDYSSICSKHIENIKNIKNEIYKTYEIQKQLAINSGGLFVLISQKQENRRIEQQFRGRAGRIQDPGETQTYISLDDEIFKINKINTKMLSNLIQEEGISSIILNHLTSRLQKQHEKIMFYSRINVMNQDHALSNGREVFFKIRNNILNDEVDLIETIFNICKNLVEDINKSDHIEVLKKYEIIINTISSKQDLEFVVKILNNNILNKKSEIINLLNKTDLLENLKTQYLNLLDHKWCIFINSKEIKKRIISLGSKIDYILDYNFDIHQLFKESLCNHEIYLLDIFFRLLFKIKN